MKITSTLLIVLAGCSPYEPALAPPTSPPAPAMVDCSAAGLEVAGAVSPTPKAGSVLYAVNASYGIASAASSQTAGAVAVYAGHPGYVTKLRNGCLVAMQAEVALDAAHGASVAKGSPVWLGTTPGAVTTVKPVEAGNVQVILGSVYDSALYTPMYYGSSLTVLVAGR